MDIREFNAICTGNNWKAEHDQRAIASQLCTIIGTCGNQDKHGRTPRVNINKLAPRRNLAPRNSLYRAYLGIKG